MNYSGKAYQKRYRTWDRTRRRENREFLKRRYRNGETTSLDVLVRELYHRDRRAARAFLIYS